MFDNTFRFGLNVVKISILQRYQTTYDMDVSDVYKLFLSHTSLLPVRKAERGACTSSSFGTHEHSFGKADRRSSIS